MLVSKLIECGPLMSMIKYNKHAKLQGPEVLKKTYFFFCIIYTCFPIKHI